MSNLFRSRIWCCPVRDCVILSITKTNDFNLSQQLETTVFVDLDTGSNTMWQDCGRHHNSVGWTSTLKTYNTPRLYSQPHTVSPLLVCVTSLQAKPQMSGMRAKSTPLEFQDLHFKQLLPEFSSMDFKQKTKPMCNMYRSVGPKHLHAMRKVHQTGWL